MVDLINHLIDILPIANFFGMGIVGPIFWLSLLILGILYFVFVKRKGGHFSNKLSYLPSQKNATGLLALTVYFSIALMIIGVILSKTLNYPRIIVINVLFLYDIFTIFLILLYFKLFWLVQNAVKIKNMVILNKLPLLFYVISILVTIILQAVTLWLFILPAVFT